MPIKIEVKGKYALFSRPEFSTERCSYDVPTASAVRGLVESIYYRPGLRYVVDRIYVLSPIVMTNIRRNEVSQKLQASKAMSYVNGKGEMPNLSPTEHRQQRASLVLKDVHYIFDVHFEMTDKASVSDNHGKFTDILKRRVKKGQCYSQPYLGCREFPAEFSLWDNDKEIPTIQETRDLGFMLLDFNYSDSTNVQPIFHRVSMENGVISLPSPYDWIANDGGELLHDSN